MAAHDGGRGGRIDLAQKFQEVGSDSDDGVFQAMSTLRNRPISLITERCRWFVVKSIYYRDSSDC